MNLIDTFESPFKLIASHTYLNHSTGFRATYKTKNIYDETTKDEIYIISKMYFDNIVNTYKRYHINDRPTTESSYRLFVEQVEDYELKQKHVYSIAYNNVEDRISWEKKFDDNFAVEGNFSIVIDINAYVFEDSEEEDEDEDEEPARKTITEPECIICFENKPNILYLECMHLCVCNGCDYKGKFYKCPMCRTKIKNQKIKII